MNKTQHRCRKIGDGVTTPRAYLYRGYRIINHGYYSPDQCVWWEAVNEATGCADFHEHTKREILKQIDLALDETR